ncbi:sigma-70 family RNA polymerase sigma factor [Nonomuraea sp. PA05]|uniref:sigma-70 family RNA polymerase sigma factor n=1 Tax=Nonomuraea sp. PA05 TaxID=2604466 RepID=UPI0011D6DB09|nr:sigma-70 family RNA polymerase sigma factor [Nonomuraea sp. PA05]TYB59810.1 sigma-70 family RNA polymerase sigma factor [Nonomuraea sp. PA05]
MATFGIPGGQAVSLNASTRSPQPLDAQVRVLGVNGRHGIFPWRTALSLEWSKDLRMASGKSAPLSAEQVREVEEFYRDTVAKTRSMVYKRLGGGAQDIDDVTTKVYIKIMERWPTVRTLQPHKRKLKWLSTTVALVVLEERRKKVGDRVRTMPGETWDRLAAVLSLPERPDSVVEMKLLYREVWNAVATHLAGNEQKVMVYDLVGLSTREAACDLNISQATVRVHRRNALKRLAGLPEITHVQETLQKGGS